MMAQRGHGTSLVTLSLEALAKKAPDVTFIHDYPGFVKTNIAQGTKGVGMFVFKAVSAVLGSFLSVPNQECGERHLFLATSAKYPPGVGEDTASGVPLADGITVATGIGGESGSGVYSVDQNGESSGPKVQELLANYRKQGLVEQLWEHTEEEFKRITGLEAA